MLCVTFCGCLRHACRTQEKQNDGEAETLLSFGPLLQGAKYGRGTSQSTIDGLFSSAGYKMAAKDIYDTVFRYHFILLFAITIAANQRSYLFHMQSNEGGRVGSATTASFQSFYRDKEIQVSAPISILQ